MHRVSVVGAGVMGCHHARVFGAAPNVVVTCVVDVDAAAARALASKVGARTCTVHEAMASSDAIVIATPMDTHASLVARALAAGLHVLVEKPICTSAERARELGEIARSRGLVLATGHSERFNPVVRALVDATLGDPVVSLSSRRHGLLQRAGRASIMLNLAVHDLDLARVLARSLVQLSSARGDSDRATLTTTREGRAFGSHEVVQNASERVRSLVAATASGAIYEADLLKKTLTCDGQALSVPDEEPLAAQARAFLSAIEGCDAPSLANAVDAAAAVALALEAEARSSRARTPALALP